MGNKIVTEADRKRTPPLPLPPRRQPCKTRHRPTSAWSVAPPPAARRTPASAPKKAAGQHALPSGPVHTAQGSCEQTLIIFQARHFLRALSRWSYMTAHAGSLRLGFEHSTQRRKPCCANSSPSDSLLA